MTKPRYIVATCEGYTIGMASGRTTDRPGLTASVLDTHIIHREVKRFRSEERFEGGGRFPRGRVGAILAAQIYANQLNAGCEPASAS